MPLQGIAPAAAALLPHVQAPYQAFAHTVQAAKEAALIPPGMRVMPEAERLETLSILDANRREVEQEIQALPFVIETPSAIKNKARLEKRLQEIAEARRIFSRPTVLVKA